MANFDIAIGVDSATLGVNSATPNALSALFAGCVQNAFPMQLDFYFTDNVPTPITISSTQPPTLSVSPSTGQATVTFSNLSLTLPVPSGATPPAPATLSATAPIMIEPTNNGTLTVSCGAFTVTVLTYPNDPSGLITDVINFIVRYLMESPDKALSLSAGLNQSLSVIQIPAPSVAGMNFQTTLEAGPPGSNDTFFMIYGALSQPVQPPAAGTTWPPGTWFAALDASALTALVGNVFPFDVSAYWSGGTIPGVCHFSVSCHNVSVSSPTFSPDTDNTISVSVSFSGKAHPAYHPYIGPNTTLPGIPFSGDLTCTATLTVASGGQYINVTLSNAAVTSFGAFGDLNDTLCAALPLGEAYGAIEDSIKSHINGLTYDAAVLSSTSFPLSGSTVTVTPQIVAVNTITPLGGVPMSLITFDLTTSVAPAP